MYLKLLTLSILNLAISVDHKHTKNLIIVYGQYRTFDLTCDTLVRNVFSHNMPAKIIFSLDESHPFKFGQSGSNCLHPYIDHITIIDGNLPTVSLEDKNYKHIEFRLVERAFKYVNQTLQSFDYAITLRADNMIMFPFPVSGIYGSPHESHGAFTIHMNRFLKPLTDIYISKLSRLPSHYEVIWAYIITAGQPNMIDNMIFHHPESNWCYLHPLEWNHPIREYIFGADSSSLRQNKTHISHNETSLLHHYRQAIVKVHTRFTVLYILGGTWVHFGRFQAMQQCSQDGMRLFGTLTWAQFGFNDSGTMSNRQWKIVPESQMRLVHLYNHWNLIDLMNPPDYQKSFKEHDKSSLTLDRTSKENTQLLAWLLRPCDSWLLPDRQECLLNRLERIEMKNF